MNGIWKYSHLLPDMREKSRITLGEGGTPLLKSRHIGSVLGLNNLYFKLEMLNPSGSYKDRFAAAAVSQLAGQSVSFCLATSSGNTGAALAAYCGAAGIPCYIAIVDGAPSGKLQQMQIYGAHTLMIKDFGIAPGVSEEVFTGLQRIAQQHNSVVQISAYRYSPVGMAGVQTIAYEIGEAVPDTAPVVFSPAGGGGLTLAIARGFRIWQQEHPGFPLPRLNCVQPEGNDTIATPLRTGAASASAVSRSTTTISGLQVPNIIDGDQVIEACRETGGTGYAVADELIYYCQKEMALREGIYAEPAGAVALAGVMQALDRKELDRDDVVICLVTGHGFKDPSAVAKINTPERGQYFNNFGETMAFIEGDLRRNQ